MFFSRLFSCSPCVGGGGTFEFGMLVPVVFSVIGGVGDGGGGIVGGEIGCGGGVIVELVVLTSVLFTEVGAGGGGGEIVGGEIGCGGGVIVELVVFKSVLLM